MKSKLFFFLLSTVLAGCQLKQIKTGEINLSRSYPSKEINLRTIADIEYLPLETTNEVLLDGSARLAYVSDTYILVWDNRGSIFIFDRNGKSVSQFNHRGKGPGEYTGISSIIFDEKNEEIFVFHNFSSSRIFVYSMFGEHKRTLNIPDDISRMTAYNFDDETLLIYDESGLEQGEYRNNPYMLLSKKDGSIVSVLDINLPVRYANTIFTSVIGSDDRQMTLPLRIGTPNNRHFGEDFVIADISSDTIFMLSKNRELAPLLIRNPSVHSSEPRIVWTSQLKTDKFILLWRIILDFVELEKDMKVSYINLIHDFETGQTNTVSFVNDDFPSWELIIAATDLAIPKNMYACLVDITLLKDAYEDNKLRGELEKLVPTLGEEDNPIVMILKFI